MRLEDLAEQTPEFLEKLSNEELEKILSPYYKVTRPELQLTKPNKRVEEQQQVYLDPKKRAFLELMREEGEDISYMLKRRKK